MPEPVVELRGISRRFDGEPPVDAVRDVDLTVERGEAVAIIGPSGSGKSTLLNVIGLLDHATAGTYLFEGTDTGALSENERAALRGSSIGFVFQSYHLLTYRSAIENVMLADVYTGVTRTGRRERALAALARVGLEHRATFPPTRLSGGERQRVAIARALMAHPSLLLCDEPTGNLDSQNTASILELFDDLRQDGLTIMLITHDADVARHSTRLTEMIDGRLTEHAVHHVDDRSNGPGTVPTLSARLAQ
jgi:putative ABC transport system ATP-binding protein